jgi:hypothetical protein
MLPTALVLAAVMIAAGAAQPVATVPHGALHACASIAADADRLACYDRLAGRAVPSAAAHEARTSPTAAAPAVAVTPPPVAAGPVATASSAAPLPATPVPPPQSFGLYEAEHPKPTSVPVAASLEARVAALGRSANGRMTALLQGGAVWELDEADPLLAVGDTVTITRAALGSYILHTPAERSHRVRRLH